MIQQLRYLRRQLGFQCLVLFCLATSWRLTSQFDRILIAFPVWSHPCAWHSNLITAVCLTSHFDHILPCNLLNPHYEKLQHRFRERKKLSWRKIAKVFFLAKLSILGYKNFDQQPCKHITYGPHKAVAEVSNHNEPIGRKSGIQLVRKSMDFTFNCFVLNWLTD